MFKALLGALLVTVMVLVRLAPTTAGLVAVKVVVKLSPTRTGLGELAAVRARSALSLMGMRVVKVRLQPWAMLPESPSASSKTYKDQVPLGLEPLKTESVAP